jgi:hypothetical protein
MDPQKRPIPRKLVDTAFRRLWLLCIPVVAVPALVMVLVQHPTVYEATGTGWVTETGSLGALRGSTPGYSESTPAQRQAQVITDLLATRSFRESIVLAAGLVAADAPAAEIAAAADGIAARVAAVDFGPNLVGVKASAATPEEAQQLAAGVLTAYQERARTESARDAGVLLTYFEQQVAQATDDVTKTRAGIAAYVKANPAVERVPDAEYQRLLALATLQEGVLQRVLQSQKDAQLAAASITATGETAFTVQDQPALPAGPLGVSMTKRAAYPAAGLALGLTISAAWLYVSFRADRTIRSAEDIESLDVAVLGAIPDLSTSEMARRFAPLRWATFFRRNYARKVAASITPDRGRMAS